MSVRLMSKVFNADIKEVSLPDGSVSATALNSILLAMADHANDDGYGSYPSLTTLQRKSKLSRPTVVKAMKGAKKMGVIVFTGVSHKGTNSYRLVENILDAIQFPTSKATLPASKATLPAGSKATLPESSIKTSEKYKKLVTLYESTIALVSDIYTAQMLADDAELYPWEWFEAAIKIAVEKNARNWKYVRAILRGWKEHYFGWKPGDRNGQAPAAKKPAPPPEDDGREMATPEMLRRAREKVAI